MLLRRNTYSHSVRREAEAAKKAEQARKKAERDALAAEEEKSLPSRAAPKKTKTAVKKTAGRGLDLSQLDDDQPSTLNASGISNAIDALSVTEKSNEKIDRHPERRYAAKLNEFKEKRLAQMKADGTVKVLSYNQRMDRIQREFDKSPDNPLNQLSVSYNASKEDVEGVRQKKRQEIESRLGQ